MVQAARSRPPAPALEDPSLQLEAWHPLGHDRKTLPRRWQGKINRTPARRVRAICMFTLRVCVYIIRTHAFPPYDALEPRRLARRLGNSTVARLASSQPSDRTQPADNPPSSRHHRREPHDPPRCNAHGSCHLGGPPPRMPCPRQLLSRRSSAGWAKRARPRRRPELPSVTHGQGQIFPPRLAKHRTKGKPRPRPWAGG